MPELPLFPLGTVLLPGASLPLQIFEPRYVALLRDLAERPPQERRFGVVAIQRGHEVGTDTEPVLATTGTAARVTEVSSGPVVPPGWCSTSRPSARTGSPWSQCAPQPAATSATTARGLGGDSRRPERAAAQAREAYRKFLASVGSPAGVPEAPADRLAYAIVQSVALPLADRQEVLAESDPARRLDLVTRLLRRESVLFGRLRLMPAERHGLGAPSQN